MLSSKRIWLIVAIGGLIITSEPFALGVPNGGAKRLVIGLGTAFQDIDRAVDGVSGAIPQNLHWNWKDSQELNADQSLRNAKLSQHERQAIARAVAAQLRSVMSKLGIKSEEQLQRAALDTRIKMIDLNNDGIPEVVAQGMAGCSPTGNCIFWIFRKSPRSYRLLLKGEAQTFTIQATTTDGFRDVVLSMHGSATESGLTDYRYIDGIYRDVGCYYASWTILEKGEERELKEPRITPCR